MRLLRENQLAEIVEEERQFDKAYELVHNSGANEIFNKIINKRIENVEKKDAERSTEHRKKGNERFQAGNLGEALHWYNMSVRAAPWCGEGENVELATSLTNRAAVLGKVGLHKAAAEDLQLSLEQGLPPHLHYKAY